MPDITYVKNPDLDTIVPDWKGNPVTNGRFVDPAVRFASSFSRFLRWQLTRNDKREEKKKDTWRLKVIKDKNVLNRKGNYLVWLGHASFFLQLNGVRILIDPIFGKIAGIIRRYSELPCAVEDIENIHYVLLSHAHRDHCDAPSLKALWMKNKPTLLTTLNTGKIVSAWVPELQCQEAGWYQRYHLKEKNLRITLLPTQHWSNRSMLDVNGTLWGAFMIETGEKTIYFGGDSGYCAHPKRAGELFPKIDIAMIGVGAYYPFFMMKAVHTGPHDALKAFHDTRAKTFIPMHYGTFDLADEPLGEPYRILKQLEVEKQIQGDLRLLDVGEVMEI